MRDPATDRAAEQQRTQDRIGDTVGDRDRVQDRDRDRVQDFDQDRDQDRSRDRDQDRQQLHVEDREQLRDRDIYGHDLMTRQERREYRNRLEAMGSDQEWAQFRAEHQARMVARARERGETLPAPLYGQHLMTDREREQHRERLQNAESAEQRRRIEAEHREQMQRRARELGVSLADLES